MKTILANRQNYGGKRSVVKYIVIHYTGNDGDTAENNAKYFKNNVTKTSAHYFVDDTEVILSVPEDYVAYSVGGKGNGPLKNICTNKNSISIELCDTVRNGTIAPTDKTVENALQLTRDLMSKYGIPKSNVVRHWDVTTKNCPAYWVNDDRWKTEFWDKIDHPRKPIEFVPIVPEDRAVYRLYNPYSGEHFFTANPAEGDSLQALGWSYEGIAWKWAEGADLPVYRLYNSYTGEHFFTANAYEKNILTIHGWNDEGEAFPSGGSTPVYRLYNEFHHYTNSLAERDKLVSDGWKDEGVAWNCEKNDHERNVIRRMISDRSNHRM